MRDENLVFDLTRVHGEQFSARIAWSLTTGIEASRKEPTLGALVSALKACRPPKVMIGSVIKEIVPYEITSVPVLAAAGLATWVDGSSGARNDYKGLPNERTDLRVYIASDIALQSCLEYLWHELLHLTSSYTHTARGGESVDVAHVDEARWDRTMNSIALEMPQTLTDPVDGHQEKLYPPFAARGCRLCARLA